MKTADKTQLQLKTGDKVIMVNCGEADHCKDRVWTCRSDSYYSKYGDNDELVFLEGFAGCFLVSCLKLAS